ncbi:MAG: putative secreted hydrolase [Halieaceae bacterium]|jgi:predicted secreted hydrolase
MIKEITAIAYGFLRRALRSLVRGLSLFLVCLGIAGTMALISGCSDPQRPQSTGDLATLAASAKGFRQASAATGLEFPRDHQAHNDYRIEWWYLTANLDDESGQPYGAQWTLFRIAQRPEGEDSNDTNPWQSPQVYMAHFAISTVTEHHAFQRYARGGSHGGQARAGVALEPFRAWIDDWFLRSATLQEIDATVEESQTPVPRADTNTKRVASKSTPPTQAWLPLEVYARQDNYSLSLALSSDQPMVLQGDAGFSRKHPNGGGSHYYSHPFLAAEGELLIDGKKVRVSGQAWLDREWSSQFLQADQSGWDWFALHLDSGEKLMLFRLHEADSETANYRHGVLISPQGEKRDLDPSAIRFEVVERTSIQGRDLPTRWRIALAELDRELLVTALHPQQWLDVDFPYWEGAVTATGGSPGESGRGYLEMVGYPAGAENTPH